MPIRLTSSGIGRISCCNNWLLSCRREDVAAVSSFLGRGTVEPEIQLVGLFEEFEHKLLDGL